MKLERVGAVLRPRAPMEATDLGVALVGRYWRDIFPAWLAICVPFIAAFAYISAETHTVWWGLFALWWIKPMLDRVPLHVLSRRFFGGEVTTSETISRTLRSWISVQMLHELTWARLIPQRAFSIPVWELERLRGSQARHRSNHLLQSARDNRSSTLLVYWSVGLMFFFTVLFTIVLLVPENVEIDFEAAIEFAFDHDSTVNWAYALVVACYGAVIAAVHPYFIATIFACYIDRRIELEGWDIELDFRRMRSRMGASVAALVACFTVLCTAPQYSYAQEVDYALDGAGDGQGDTQTNGYVDYDEEAYVGGEYNDDEYVDDDYYDESAGEDEYALPSVSTEKPQDLIEQILAAEEFGKVVKKTEWRRRKTDDPETDYGGIFSFVGQLFRGLAWAAAATILLLALYYIGKRIRPPQRRPTYEPRIATTSIEDVEEHVEFTLPPHLAAEARSLWSRGDQIGALSLLYRGVVEHLRDDHGLAIGVGTTAREVATMAKQAGGPGPYVKRLATAWTSLVYADRPIDDAEAHALFEGWERFFGGDE